MTLEARNTWWSVGRGGGAAGKRPDQQDRSALVSSARRPRPVPPPPAHLATVAARLHPPPDDLLSRAARLRARRYRVPAAGAAAGRASPAQSRRPRGRRWAVCSPCSSNALPCQPLCASHTHSQLCGVNEIASLLHEVVQLLPRLRLSVLQRKDKRAPRAAAVGGLRRPAPQTNARAHASHRTPRTCSPQVMVPCSRGGGGGERAAAAQLGCERRGRGRRRAR